MTTNTCPEWANTVTVVDVSSGIAVDLDADHPTAQKGFQLDFNFASNAALCVELLRNISPEKTLEEVLDALNDGGRWAFVRSATEDELAHRTAS